MSPYMIKLVATLEETGKRHFFCINLDPKIKIANISNETICMILGWLDSSQLVPAKSSEKTVIYCNQLFPLSGLYKNNLWSSKMLFKKHLIIPL